MGVQLQVDDIHYLFNGDGTQLSHGTSWNTVITKTATSFPIALMAHNTVGIVSLDFPQLKPAYFARHCISVVEHNVNAIDRVNSVEHKKEFILQKTTFMYMYCTCLSMAHME